MGYEFFLFHCNILFASMILISNVVVYSMADISAAKYNIQDFIRNKRSLVFPNPLKSETKIQVLFGLGLPMEGEISMTLGYVLKCNYVLPYNASMLTDGAYVRYVRSSTREYEEAATGIKQTPNMTTSSADEEHLGHSRTDKPQNSSRPGPISRWNLYRILEMAMGKACLLRAVCEASETPFTDNSAGLLGQLLRLFLRPSTTNEDYELYSDREYIAAELIGNNSSNSHACRSSYPECYYSPLDYFTKIIAPLSRLP